jgi:hypothetical protein
MSTRGKILCIFVFYTISVGFYYLAYRYPLQYNAMQTSYAYVSTPFYLKMGKYLLIILGCAVVFYTLVATQSAELSSSFSLIVFLGLFGQSFVYSLICADLRLLEVSAFLPVGLTLYFFGDAKLNIPVINRLLSWTVWLAVLAIAIQVTLYHFIGRLPALAWPGGSIRFGSFLDDPNGFGVLCCMLMGFALFYYSGPRKVVALVLLGYSLLMTKSLTAFITFFAVIGALVGSRIVFGDGRKKSTQLLFIAFVCLGLAVISIFVFFFSGFFLELPYISAFLSRKALSIAEHLRPYRLIFAKGMPFKVLLGFSPLGRDMTEVEHLNLVRSFGIVFWFLYIWVGVAASYRYARHLFQEGQRTEVKAFSAAAGCFLIAHLVGMFGIPYAHVFPNNLFYILFSALALCGVRFQEESTNR